LALLFLRLRDTSRVTPGPPAARNVWAVPCGAKRVSRLGVLKQITTVCSGVAQAARLDVLDLLIAAVGAKFGFAFK